MGLQGSFAFSQLPVWVFFFIFFFHITSFYFLIGLRMTRSFLISFFLFLGWNTHDMKFTILIILKDTVRWLQAHSHCWVTITTTHLQNFFIFQNWNSEPIKHQLPTPYAQTPGNCHLYFSVSMNVTLLDILYEWNHTVIILSVMGLLHLA